MAYADDITLERRFAKTIKAILGCYFITQDEIADRQEGTDFAIFMVRPFRVGVRLRRYDAFLKWPDQFTIRWSRPSGANTERHKIAQGLVDYILYGFVNETEDKIIRYFIGDLGIFRSAQVTPLCVKPNVPPDSYLAAFAIAQFPPRFVLKAWPDAAPAPPPG